MYKTLSSLLNISIKFDSIFIKMPKRASTSPKFQKNVKAKPMPAENKTAKSEKLCTILDTPIKSLSDKKLYRTIKLANELTALLISDESAVTSDTDSSDNDSCESDDEICSVESDASAHSINSSTCGSNKKPKTKLAAASLTIGVGSFSDPYEVQGLAHFLEHMVFMGSKAFPVENDFECFIKKKGGSDNAHTGMENTNFYFDVRESSFEESLFKFAQFFIEPLLLQEAMTRERKAVESEFQIATQSDGDRVEQFLLSLACDGHPARNFSWGNEVSLQQNVTDDVLQKHLHNFRIRHYSSNRMTLAVQSKKSLDDLQQMVVEIFSKIPNNQLAALDLKQFAGDSAFNVAKFNQIYYVKPVRNIFQVNLTWAMSSLLSLYRFKPVPYISWIIGYEGTGSLFAYLRDKLWAVSIEAGNSEQDSEHNSLYCLFGINLVLTEEGMKNLEHVLNAIFSYLALIKEKGVTEKIFNDMKLLEDMNFQYMEESEPVDNVEEISANMQIYPPKDYLTGPDLMFEYNSDYIIQVLNKLSPDSVNIIILDSTLGDNIYNQMEPWFSTRYVSKEISPTWKKVWRDIKPYPSFDIPNVSHFLTSDFQIIEVLEPMTIIPTKVDSGDTFVLWHKYDDIFKLPRAHMCFSFISPLPHHSAKNAALLDIYVLILKYVLVEKLYPATVANLNYSIYAASKGFIVKIYGFNEKLPIVFQIICQTMITLLSELEPDTFEVLKEQQLKNYHNYFIKPSHQIKELRSTALLQIYWPILDKYLALKEVAYDDLKWFSCELLKSMYLKSLTQGNMDVSTAQETINEAVKSFSFKQLPPDALIKSRVVQVPEGEKIICMLSLNEADTNSVVTNYYQTGYLSLSDYAIMQIITTIMVEPVFNILRTKEQLGYDVGCDIANLYGILGLTISVHYQADKFQPQYINERIEAFLTEFKSTLRNLTAADYKDFQNSLINILQSPDIDLEQEVSRNWSEITSGEYMFDRISKEVDYIKNTTLEDVIQWLEDRTMGGSAFRKLSLQVLGNNKNEDKTVILSEESKMSVDLSDKEFGKKRNRDSHYESHLVNLNGNDSNQYITNLKKFKNEQYLYPVLKTILS